MCQQSLLLVCKTLGLVPIWMQMMQLCVSSLVLVHSRPFQVMRAWIGFIPISRVWSVENINPTKNCRPHHIHHPHPTATVTEETTSKHSFRTHSKGRPTDHTIDQPTSGNSFTCQTYIVLFLDFSPKFIQPHAWIVSHMG